MQISGFWARRCGKCGIYKMDEFYFKVTKGFVIVAFMERKEKKINTTKFEVPLKFYLYICKGKQARFQNTVHGGCGKLLYKTKSLNSEISLSYLNFCLYSPYRIGWHHFFQDFHFKTLHEVEIPTNSYAKRDKRMLSGQTWRGVWVSAKHLDSLQNGWIYFRFGCSGTMN